jgi:hypothetical protein
MLLDFKPLIFTPSSQYLRSYNMWRGCGAHYGKCSVCREPHTHGKARFTLGKHSLVSYSRQRTHDQHSHGKGVLKPH